MKLIETLRERIVILDGGMGSEIMHRIETGVPFPEILNRERPEIIRAIHSDYLEAGADIITTNTLGGNRIKLREHGAEARTLELNRTAVSLALESRGERPGWIAGSIGPTGKLIAPLGELAVGEAFDGFAEQADALAAAGADLILIETQIDVLEARTALRAARSVCDIPVAVTMTFPLEDGRTITGTDPAAAAAAFSHADIFGLNCGGHPESFPAHIEKIREHSSLPLIIYANAGVPRKKDGALYFPLEPEGYLEYARNFFNLGGNIIGGCCGTTPGHIRLISKALRNRPPETRPDPLPAFRATSRNGLLTIGTHLPFRAIGENINPFARKSLRRELKQGRMELAHSFARRQEAAGADALDINLGKRGEKEPDFYADAVNRLQSVSRIPLLLDNGHPESLEAALKLYAGKAVINSMTGEERSFGKLLPLARAHGAGLILLALNEDGIPDRAEDRLRIIEDLRGKALHAGFTHDDLLADPITLSLSASAAGPRETLRTIALLSERGIPTIIGLSNISFGLPRRGLLNSVFLNMALASGLDSAILNPLDAELMRAVAAAESLSGRDPGVRRYISRFAESQDISETLGPVPETESPEDALFRAIREGEKERIAPSIERLLQEGKTGLEILEENLTPALRKAGDDYEKGIAFLPQLILSAEAMEVASQCLARTLPTGQPGRSGGRIVLATVRGDLHDIGKNIVALMLRNFGFHVMDLGKNVDPRRIVETAKAEAADVIGLSALMTTTLDAMEEVMRMRNAIAPEIKVIVGGAAVSPAFAESIGADAHGKDAMEAVRRVGVLLGESPKR